MFSNKAKSGKNLNHQFDTYLSNVKSTMKIWSIFVAFLENMNLKEEPSSKDNIFAVSDKKGKLLPQLYEAFYMFHIQK